MKSSTPQHFTPRRIQFLVLLGLLAQADAAFCSGVITNCTQADLQAALVGGGAVTFACNGTITLTNTLNITQDTTIDATGYQVKISGGNAVRLLTVTNASFGVTALTLADGRFVGANGTTAPNPGQEGGGGCILNQSGTLTLVNCALTNHLAQGGNAGRDGDGYFAGNGGVGKGGAVCSLGGQVNLTNCLVVGCASAGGLGCASPSQHQAASGPGLGGGFYLAGSALNMQGVVLTNDWAMGGNETYNLSYVGLSGDANGGAIYATNSYVCAGSSVLAGNGATSGTELFSVAGAATGDGGGGAVFLVGASVGVFDLCTLAANVATAARPGYHGSAGSGFGGAVFNGGQLRIHNCTWVSNSASSFGGLFGQHIAQGGALYSTNAATISGSTFYNNLAQGGNGGIALGGPYNSSSGTGEGGGVWSRGVLLATNCTWATNQAAAGVPGYGTPVTAASGGGVCVSGGSAVLVNVTLAGNRADASNGNNNSPGPSQGGGVMNTNGSVLILNSVFANSPSVTNVYYNVLGGGSNVWGVVTDGGYNLSSDTTGGFTAAGSLMNTDPMLAPLANYGGPTLTMWLLPGSPAHDRIPAGFPPTDQRGAPRPQGPAADMGAVEADNPPAAPFGVVSGCSGTNLTLSCTADDWRAYRLLRSTDLASWTAIATNSSDGCGKARFAQPATGLRAFYRVVTP